MTGSRAAPPSPEVPSLADRLVGATPQERRGIVLGLIEVQRVLRLPPPESPSGARPALDGLDLGRDALKVLAERAPGATAPWWDGEAARPSLRGADLAGAALREAVFTGADLGASSFAGATLSSASFREANVEEASFEGADLIGADFTAARAGEGNFRDAMLEDARFAGASVRFADFGRAVIDNADFSGADLWGARLNEAEGNLAVFKDAHLEEVRLTGANLPGADFENASLKKTDLKGAVLKGANFQDAMLVGADLSGADLGDARLAGVVLSSCKLEHVRLAGAWLEKTRFRREQLGGAIGEEVAGDYDDARVAYLALEQNFRGLGDPEAASWAYRQSRRMAKAHARAQGVASWKARKWRRSQRHWAHYAADVFVEWLCDYGESLTRVVRAFFVACLLFASIYWASNSLTQEVDTPVGGHEQADADLGDIMIFSLLTMTEAGPPEMDIKPRGGLGYILGGVQGAVGIALLGLFGFVAGNRIRR